MSLCCMLGECAAIAAGCAEDQGHACNAAGRCHCHTWTGTPHSLPPHACCDSCCSRAWVLRKGQDARGQGAGVHASMRAPHLQTGSALSGNDRSAVTETGHWQHAARHCTAFAWLSSAVANQHFKYACNLHGSVVRFIKHQLPWTLIHVKTEHVAA